MSLVKKFKNVAKSFGANKSGNITIATALLVPVIFGSAGLAIEYSRMTNTKTKLNNALDAAILVAGNNFSLGMPVNAQFREDFENTFKANFVGSMGGAGADYDIQEFNADSATGKVGARIEAQIDGSFSKLLGYNELKVVSESSAIFQQTETEVSIMLDITGSMKGQKLSSLKSAAKSAVDILLSDANKNSTRVALVPYGSSLNAGKYAKKVTRNNNRQRVAGGDFISLSNNVPTTSCVTERGGSDAATDAFWKDARIGSDARTVDGPTADFRCPSSEIVPLTNNRNKLKGEINKMVARGGTAGHIGVAWSYYMLSDKWAPLWKASAAKPFSDDVQKIAIIMTDGEFNTFFDGVQANANYSFQYAPFFGQDTKSAGLARDLCANMKALKDGNPGITIYSVAFEAPDAAQELLRDCATEDTASQTYYYAANNGDQLKEAFEDIAQSIKSLRLSR